MKKMIMSSQCLQKQVHSWLGVATQHIRHLMGAESLRLAFLSLANHFCLLCIYILKKYHEKSRNGNVVQQPTSGTS